MVLMAEYLGAEVNVSHGKEVQLKVDDQLTLTDQRTITRHLARVSGSLYGDSPLQVGL